MDYCFLWSIKQNPPASVVVSYDIACQWSKNLLARRAVYSPSLVAPTVDLRYFIPKFHIYAHRDQCQYNYSFNYRPWVGRTDGEAVERSWSALNGLASSTKEMGPGSRRDTLDDHFADYNWRKITSLSQFCRLSNGNSRTHIGYRPGTT